VDAAARWRRLVERHCCALALLAAEASAACGRDGAVATAGGCGGTGVEDGRGASDWQVAAGGGRAAVEAAEAAAWSMLELELQRVVC